MAASKRITAASLACGSGRYSGTRDALIAAGLARKGDGFPGDPGQGATVARFDRDGRGVMIRFRAHGNGAIRYWLEIGDVQAVQAARAAEGRRKALATYRAQRGARPPARVAAAPEIAAANDVRAEQQRELRISAGAAAMLAPLLAWAARMTPAEIVAERLRIARHDGLFQEWVTRAVAAHAAPGDDDCEDDDDSGDDWPSC